MSKIKLGGFQAKRKQGFTLIELVMVIVILGILAAVALPKLADLSNEARTAKTGELAGMLSAASVANFAAFKAGKPDFVPVTAATSSRLQTRLEQMVGNGWTLPSSYSISFADSASLGCNSGMAETTMLILENVDAHVQKPFLLYCTH